MNSHYGSIDYSIYFKIGIRGGGGQSAVVRPGGGIAQNTGRGPLTEQDLMRKSQNQ